MREFRKQARKAQRVAYRMVDKDIAGEMKPLADAFRFQAKIIKKTRKKKGTLGSFTLRPRKMPVTDQFGAYRISDGRR